MRYGRVGLTLVLALYASSAGSTGEPFQVIVNQDNAVSSMTRVEITRLFLKKMTRWHDGVNVTPVDLPIDSAVRDEFSRVVMERSTQNVSAYWRRALFSGRASPPRSLATDSEVVAFVSKNRGAIGYVSASSPLDGVKRLTVLNGGDGGR